MKKKCVNHYTVIAYGTRYESKLAFGDALNYVKALIALRGFDVDEFIAKYGGLQAFVTKLFRDENDISLYLRPVSSGTIIEVESQPNMDAIAKMTHQFNGKALKHNSLEMPSRYKPGTYQPKEVRMYEVRGYALNTLPRAKKEKPYFAQEITYSMDVATLSSDPVLDILAKALKDNSPVDVLRTYRKKYPHISRKSMGRMIAYLNQ